MVVCKVANFELDKLENYLQKFTIDDASLQSAKNIKKILLLKFLF